MKRVVLLGCISFSEAVLKSLITRKHCTVVGVCTNSQSTYNSDSQDLSKTCKHSKIDILDIKDINSKKKVHPRKVVLIINYLIVIFCKYKKISFLLQIIISIMISCKNEIIFSRTRFVINII